jgi:hypothetical protein
MNPTTCDHRWSASNVRQGYLIIEGCFQCKGRAASFFDGSIPPVEDHRDGDHFWSHMGRFQASRFDLKCAKCSKEIPLGEMVALMLCRTCDPECGVFEAGMLGEIDLNSRVCVALCADTTHGSKQCIGHEGLRALNEYFEDRYKDTGKKVLVVPCILRRSADTCQGVTLADVGLGDLN